MHLLCQKKKCWQHDLLCLDISGLEENNFTDNPIKLLEPTRPNQNQCQIVYNCAKCVGVNRNTRLLFLVDALANLISVDF